MSSDEIDVWLRPHDIDHLQDGQPVFKQGNGELIVIRTGDYDGSVAKTQGMIDGQHFELSVEGPEALMTEIEGALAELKYEVENDE